MDIKVTATNREGDEDMTVLYRAVQTLEVVHNADVQMSCRHCHDPLERNWRDDVSGCTRPSGHEVGPRNMLWVEGASIHYDDTPDTPEGGYALELHAHLSGYTEPLFLRLTPNADGTLRVVLVGPNGAELTPEVDSLGRPLPGVFRLPHNAAVLRWQPTPRPLTTPKQD